MKDLSVERRDRRLQWPDADLVHENGENASIVVATDSVIKPRLQLADYKYARTESVTCSPGLLQALPND
jgi:hypothetical protein